MSKKGDVGIDLGLEALIEANAVRLSAATLMAGETTGFAVGIAAVSGALAGAGLILAATAGLAWVAGGEQTSEEIETALQNVFPLLSIGGTALGPIFAGYDRNSWSRNVSLYAPALDLGMSLGVAKDLPEARQAIEETLLGSRDFAQAISHVPSSQAPSLASRAPGQGALQEGHPADGRSFAKVVSKVTPKDTTPQDDGGDTEMSEHRRQQLLKGSDPLGDPPNDPTGVERVYDESGPFDQNFRQLAPGNGNLRGELGSEQEHGAREFNFDRGGERVAGPDQEREGLDGREGDERVA